MKNAVVVFLHSSRFENNILFGFPKSFSLFPFLALGVVSLVGGHLLLAKPYEF